MKGNKDSKSKVRKLQVKTETAKDLRLSDQKSGKVKGGVKCAAFPGSQAPQQCGAIFSKT